MFKFILACFLAIGLGAWSAACGNGEQGPDKCPPGTKVKSIEYHEYGATDVTIICSDGTVISR